MCTFDHYKALSYQSPNGLTSLPSIHNLFTFALCVLPCADIGCQSSGMGAPIAVTFVITAIVSSLVTFLITFIGCFVTQHLNQVNKHQKNESSKQAQNVATEESKSWIPVQQYNTVCQDPQQFNTICARNALSDAY